MVCKKCGNELEEGDKFCTVCGNKIEAEELPMSFSLNQNSSNNLATNSQLNQNNNIQYQNLNHFPQQNLNSNQLLMNPTNDLTNPILDNNTVTNSQKEQQNIQMPVPPMMNNSISIPTNLESTNNQQVQNPTVGIQELPKPQNVEEQKNNQKVKKTPRINNKKKNYKKIAIIFAVIIILLIGLCLGLVINNAKLRDDNSKKEEMLKPYKVQLNGFEVKVPGNYVYNVTNGKLLIKDEKDTWVIRISFKSSSYESLKSRRNYLKKQLEESGCITKGATIEHINGKEIIKLNYELTGKKINAAYSKINSMYLATIEGSNIDNTYDDELLKKAIEVVKTASYTGRSNKN